MSEHFIPLEQAETDFLACAAFIGERIKSSDGHADAMKAIVPRYLSRNDVDLAADLANAVEDPFSRDRLLIVVAEKCAELDDDEYAVQLAEAIEDHGMQAQAFERVALVKAKKGNTEKAAEIGDAMSHPDFVYAGIAVYMASNGDSEGAEKALGRIEFPPARVSALQNIAGAHMGASEPDKAIDALDQAVTAANEIEHDEERIRSLCDIGTLFLDAKRNDKAIETFDQARGFAEVLDNIHRDVFLVNCALGFLYAGSSELADNTLDLVTDKTQMSSALVGFAREYWKKEEKDDALETLDEAHEILKSQRDIETRDSRARNGLFATIAAQFAGFGKTDRAVEVALANQDPDERTAALSQIAQILVVQKEDDLARQTINLIDEDANRLYALVAVSDSKNKLGETEASLSLLEEAAGLADSVPQLTARSGVMNRIAERFVAHGQPEKARSIAIDNLGVITEIRDESSKAVALASMADVYAEADLELGDDEKQHLQAMAQKSAWQ